MARHRLLLLALLATPALGGCAVTAVADAAIDVGATTVGVGAKVAGTAAGAVTDTAGAAVRTATGGGKKDQR